ANALGAEVVVSPAVLPGADHHGGFDSSDPYGARRNVGRLAAPSAPCLIRYATVGRDALRPCRARFRPGLFRTAGFGILVRAVRNTLRFSRQPLRRVAAAECSPV